jgi:hypothetical protein
MRRRGASLIALCLALALLPASAQAGTFPGERPSTSPMVDRMLEAGYRFWNARGVSSDLASVVYVADSLATDARGIIPESAEQPGHRIWVLSALVNEAVRFQRARSLGLNQPAQEVLCAVIFHGLGHNFGLGHTDSGLMGAVQRPMTVPWDCKVLRRQFELGERIRLARAKFLGPFRLRGALTISASPVALKATLRRG